MRKDEFPIVDKLVKDSINDVLDKIRAEIEQGKMGLDIEFNYGLNYALQIIDKYKIESEAAK